MTAGALGSGQDLGDEMMQGDETGSQEENVWLASQFFDKVSCKDCIMSMGEKLNHSFQHSLQVPSRIYVSLSVMFHTKRSYIFFN